MLVAFTTTARTTVADIKRRYNHFFSQTQVSIHVTVLYRHTSAAKDEIDSTEDDPLVVTDHVFVISPDVKHDHHSATIVVSSLQIILKIAEILPFFTNGQMDVVRNIKADTVWQTSHTL